MLIFFRQTIIVTLDTKRCLPRANILNTLFLTVYIVMEAVYIQLIYENLNFHIGHFYNICKS